MYGTCTVLFLKKTKKIFESHVDKFLPSLDYYIEKKWLQPDCGTLGSFSSICFSFIFFFFPRFSAIWGYKNMYNVSLFLEYWKPFFLKEFCAKLWQVKIQRRCFLFAFPLKLCCFYYFKKFYSLLFNRTVQQGYICL